MLHYSYQISRRALSTCIRWSCALPTLPLDLHKGCEDSKSSPEPLSAYGNNSDCFEVKMSQTANASPSSLMALHSDTHKQNILSKFDKLRKRDLLCDITLVVEDVHFKAHKALLAASSEYFSLMFTAEDHISQSTYQLDGMAAKMFAAVLDFIYSAQVCVEEGATEQLLATACLMEVNDLVKVLTELTRSVAAVRGEKLKGDIVEVADLSKRKRGRPKKNVPVVTELEGRSAQCEGSEEGQAGHIDCDDVVAESQPKDDADYNPGAHQSRQSKRKIRPPVKYKSYKVGSDTAGSKETGKRGRKRKYPNTEARCEDCGKEFKNHLFLKIHQRTHTGEKPFRCLVCGKAFTQKHTLLVHQRMHTGEKPFVCTICSKALSTKHSLQEHMNLHEEAKSFSCDKCGKTFTQKRQLKSHYRVHTGKSLPECAQCHHKFMDTAQLKKHLRTHTGEKPFTCEICGKCFTAKSTLQTHIRIHSCHFSKTPSPPPPLHHLHQDTDCLNLDLQRRSSLIRSPQDSLPSPVSRPGGGGNFFSCKFLIHRSVYSAGLLPMV